MPLNSLLTACKNKNFLEAKRILEEEECDTVNALDEEDLSALHYTCQSTKNRSGLITQLIENGANVNARDDQNRTPLMLAVIAGNLSNVKALLNENASTCLRDTTHKSALDYALDYAVDLDQKDIIKALQKVARDNLNHHRDDSSDEEEIAEEFQAFDIDESYNSLARQMKEHPAHLTKASYTLYALALQALYSPEVNREYYPKKTKLSDDEENFYESVQAYLGSVTREMLKQFSQSDYVKDNKISVKALVETVMEKEDVIAFLNHLAFDRALLAKADMETVKKTYRPIIKPLIDSILTIIIQLNPRHFATQPSPKRKNIRDLLVTHFFDEFKKQRDFVRPLFASWHFVSHNPLQAFANIRLFNRSMKRRIHNAKESQGPKVLELTTTGIEPITTFTSAWSNGGKHYVNIDHTLFKSLKRSDLVKDARKYSDINKRIDSIKSKLKETSPTKKKPLITDAFIAKCIRKAFRHQSLELLDEFNLDKNTANDIKTMIYNTSNLIFNCEAIRHPSAHFTHQMTLDLILAGKMTWEEALVKSQLPMASKDFTKIARCLQEKFNPHVPHPYYRYEYENKEKLKDDDLRTFMQHEYDIIAKWLKLKDATTIKQHTPSSLAHTITTAFSEWFCKNTLTSLYNHYQTRTTPTP